MIQAVCESCSVRWTKVNRKVYKFQSLVFSEESHENETSHSSSESICHDHSKITAPTQWKQVYGEYLGKDYEVPKGMVGSELPVMLQTDSKIDNTTDNDDVTSCRKESRRVRFQDEIEHEDNKDDKQTQKIGCLSDCYLCRSINQRKTSPPYEALPEQMIMQPDL